MKRAYAVAGSLLFLLIAPGSIAVWVPWMLSRWQMHPPLLNLSLFRLLGVTLIILGLPLLLDSFARFALEGLGTPAPIAPPTRLVVSGFYRYVRNPMYVGVVFLILGQALFLGSTPLLSYCAFIWAAFHIFVLIYEEPSLRQTFGQQYETFCTNVPRWIPRVTPWKGE